MNASPGGDTGSGDWYARRLASAEYRASRVEKAEVLRRLIGGRIAAARTIGDVGTGTGIIKKELEQEYRKPFIGFELDTDFVVERERVIGADACRLPVADGGFDLLILNHVYEHVADPRRLFAEAFRILAPGGAAYVAAGSRWAVLEPHYRLPFLSWLPRPLADRYLRLTGRGRAYEGIRFLGFRPLVRLMRTAGFRVRDLTQVALAELIGPGRGEAWKPAWTLLRACPPRIRARLLEWGSPQWFFLLEKPRPQPNGGGGEG